MAKSMRPCYKQTKDAILLNIGKLFVFFCACSILAIKFSLICYCYNVQQTGCCRIVLIKKQIFETASLYFHRFITQSQRQKYIPIDTFPFIQSNNYTWHRLTCSIQLKVHRVFCYKLKQYKYLI